MPINSLLYPSNVFIPVPHDVDNSLRFNSASADSLTRTTSGAGTSNQKFTMSLWVKKSSNDSAARRLIELYNTSSYYVSLRFRDDHSNRLDFYSESNGAGVNLRTNRSFRDTSAWYHIVFAVDTTDSTANDRMKMYVNGVEETSFASRTNFGSNENINFNNSGDNQLISISESASNTENDRKFNGYMAEVCFIDGQALAPTSFGEFDEDSGVWSPIDVSTLTFGNNGYYLEFKESGTSTNSSGMGADTSGNDNHFAVNNLTAVDQSTDTCTNNFATLNPLYTFNYNLTFSDGNLSASGSQNQWQGASSTMAINTGKWFYEAKFTSATDIGNSSVGFMGMEDSVYSNATRNFVGFYNYDGGEIWVADSGHTPTTNDYGTFSNGDIIGIALDYDNEYLTVYKNGSAIVTNFDYGAVSTSSYVKGGKFIAPKVFNYGSGTISLNFGNPPYAISSSNADANGHGNFEYAVPSGYFALCSKNLAEFG